MSTLQSRLLIHCPLAQADARLRAFFREHGNPEGSIARLILHAQIPLTNAQAPILERAVIVTIRPHPYPEDMTPRYRLQWAPEVPGPLPLFAGELFVEGDEDYNCFFLKLNGTYTPPLGFVGKGFDAVIGHRIACNTAQDLLERIRDHIQEQFSNEESQKQHDVAIGVGLSSN